MAPDMNPNVIEHNGLAEELYHCIYIHTYVVLYSYIIICISVFDIKSVNETHLFMKLFS